MVPTPSQDCGPQQITIPTVQCEDITEERYQYNKDQENKKFEQFHIIKESNKALKLMVLETIGIQCIFLTDIHLYSRCVQLPSVSSTQVEAEQCTVPLGQPQCNQVRKNHIFCFQSNNLNFPDGSNLATASVS